MNLHLRDPCCATPLHVRARANGGINAPAYTATYTAADTAIETAINPNRNYDPRKQEAVSRCQDGFLHIDRRRIPEEIRAGGIGPGLACRRSCMSCMT